MDDNVDHVQLAVRALRAQPDWKIDTARLGEECIQRVGTAEYDLVLLDYRLPDMTGLDVLRRIRPDGNGPDVLMMTSQGSEEVAMEAIEAGAQGYVVKNADFGRRLAFEVGEWAAAREQDA